MTKPLDQITERDYATYERVRRTGKYNMLDAQAIRDSGLDKSTYLGVLTHYALLMEKFPNVREDS